MTKRKQAFTYTASRLTPTVHDNGSVEPKVKFIQQFIRFVDGGFKRSDFPKWFYVRLSMCFGFIAHYNQEGFYQTYFENDSDKLDFRMAVLRYPCYGSPEYTYCDAERIIQEYLKSKGY